MPDVYPKEIEMPRKSTKVVEYEVSSGNVYTDLGFADSAEMLAKARIVAQIGRIIQAHKLTQAEAGELMNIDQPKVSALLRGHFRGYSQERLIGFLTKLGMDVEIVVRPKAKKRQAAGSVSVTFA
jgi:predicted XRE-type DNA-binding protein